MNHPDTRVRLRRSDSRRQMLYGDRPWYSSVAVLTFFGVCFQLYPRLTSGSAIALAFGPNFWAVRLWALLVLGGSVFVWIGVWQLNARWDVAGSLTLATWSLTYAYAVFATRGPHIGFVGCSMFSAYFVLCVGRAWVLANPPTGVPAWRSRR